MEKKIINALKEFGVERINTSDINEFILVDGKYLSDSFINGTCNKCGKQTVNHFDIYSGENIGYCFECQEYRNDSEFFPLLENLIHDYERNYDPDYSLKEYCYYLFQSEYRLEPDEEGDHYYDDEDGFPSNNAKKAYQLLTDYLSERCGI